MSNILHVAKTTNKAQQAFDLFLSNNAPVVEQVYTDKLVVSMQNGDVHTFCSLTTPEQVRGTKYDALHSDEDLSNIPTYTVALLP